MRRFIRKTIFCTVLSLFIPSMQATADDFTFGADISWATEMEHKGERLYNYQGEERDAFTLMKEMGLSAVRLRVWVNPERHGGWCNKEDVLTKARRAQALGMDVMIDFHYSDWWADPAKQNIPAAWAKHKYKQMLIDVANHTTEVLSLLKDNGINVKWVQVGNETTYGMLWTVKTDPNTGWEIKDDNEQTTIVHSMGHIEKNPEQYAGFFKAGYEATKTIYPEAKVIVHLDKGYSNSLYNKNLEILRKNGAKWDIIGMSIYPYWSRKHESSVPRLFAECIRNMKALVKKYGTDVMVVETGFEVNEAEPWIMEAGREQLAELIRLCKNETDGHCCGLFYWEPTCRPKQYKLGAFSESGHPTSIMRAFTTNAIQRQLGVTPKTLGDIKYDRPIVKLQTTLGDILIELYNETPKHRDNFINIVERGILDSTLFHRAMFNFMIQGGDPSSKNADETTAEFPATQLGYTSATNANGEEYTIQSEILYPKFFNKRGAVGAARADKENNPELRSSSSQFYIAWGKWPTARKVGSEQEPLPYYQEHNLAGVPYLDGQYTVFGEVIQGLDIIDKVQRSKVDQYDRPVNDVRIIKAEVIR
ncbi:MAG: glycosyl hydrolase 53 family protein [Prevotellaceae bacterium]|nr:glycosyl hydrolase 53 family protein [Prevotellaceae bacterium]MDO4932875.1 glycosyl hydrolase 53 family protein [Prevotellaceae bacterium]